MRKNKKLGFNSSTSKALSINRYMLNLVFFFFSSFFLLALLTSKVFAMGYFAEDKPSIFDYQGIGAFTDVLKTNSMPYDESASASMQEKVKQVDNALLQTLNRLDLDLNNFKVENSYVRLDADTVFLFQKIRLALPTGLSAVEWTNALTEQLNLWAHSTRVSTDYKNNKTSIYIDKELTHEIYYRGLDASAKLSIVIDDLGNNTDVSLSLLKLEYPITFSILPDNRYPELTATLAHYANREVFLHQPMEARNNAFAVPIGFRIFDSKENIKEKLVANLALIPHATGLNNHTGSAFSETEFAVVNFLEVLQEVRPSMHVLDSYTIAGSKIHELAPKYGFRSMKRDVFIDNVQDVAEIKKQLDKALNLALENPDHHVIAIGHPHKSTLSALATWNTYKEKNVEIIQVFPTY